MAGPGTARFEAVLFVLLLLTIAAVIWQDSILTRTTRLTPQSIADYPSLIHTDANPEIKGNSRGHTLSPMRWTCDLKAGFDYPYCGYEVFFNKAGTTRGLDLTNFKSIRLVLTYTGPGKSLRVHLKNFDPRYADAVENDSAKFNRVEAEATSGREQAIEFTTADFGVADWWLLKHKIPPKLSHPQFDNVTSIDVQTGTEIALGRHAFAVKEIVIRTAILSDAQYYLALLAAWLALLCAWLGWRVHKLRGELRRRRAGEQDALRQAEQAEDAARSDPLTGLLNRRGMAERFAAIADGDPQGIAVILIDIDHFKSLNDRFGHAHGDEVLVNIAALIRLNVRGGDAVGRWGGEEFIALCHGLDADGAQQLATTLRRRIESFHFGQSERVTASLGVHFCPSAGPDLATLIGFADVALYSAKHSGRNCVRVYRPGMAKAA